MSGIVLMIPDVDYSQENIGQVSILQDVDVSSIQINGASIVEGASEQYTVSYTPATTSQVGVDWSIDSGNEFVSINSNGLLSLINPVTEAVTVVIRATSIFNSSVTATKTVRLSTGASIPVNVTYTNGSRKATQTGINTSYTSMATFTNECLLNWKTESYKVTIDSTYKAYFAAVRGSDFRCGARSSTLYTDGEFNVTEILEQLGAGTNYEMFALVVVAASYNPSSGTGPTVDPNALPSHISITRTA